MSEDRDPYGRDPFRYPPTISRDTPFRIKRFRRNTGFRYALDRAIDWVLIALFLPYGVVKGVIVGVSELFGQKRGK